MEIHEALDILQRIAASYTQFDLTGEIGERRIEVWSLHLMKMPYKPVLERVNQHILREKFPPTIAEVSVKVQTNNEFLDEQSQWREQVKQEKKAGNHKTFVDHLSPELKKKYGSFLRK
ncbi:replicative helicase loader/inhibitor [Priestia megaterium]|uniref:replicative helicase loader/inhibitor n=1 Tax=Priestia megaterium TaxID=1404 RepID=UPI0027318CD0|nr:replicative helicase loader/inhibitor [Priestia megaterium]MDP1441933.1 replicative helicase loader/inhibitor [Priestia megaterium]MDP1471002.1 replicative helicase loader/inhibitor [Priestia megaterium]